MPLGNWNLEWPGHNSQRNYPLAADATAQDVTGSFNLPESFILALYLPVHSGLNVDPGQFFVKTVGVYQAGFSVVVGYQPSNGDPAVVVASAQIARITHAAGNVYNLGGLKSGAYDFTDTRGRITIGQLDEIDTEPGGLWNFDLDGGRLEADAVRPIIRGLSSISIANGDEVSGPFYGHFLLRAGTNHRIDYDQFEGKHRLTFNAIDGEGLTEDCVCGDDTAEPIKTINGIGPDINGNFNLLGDTCVQLEEIENGLIVKDSCVQPCCGCAELAEITSRLEEFGSQGSNIELFLSRLEASVSQMELTVLGSKLGDRNCLDS